MLSLTSPVRTPYHRLRAGHKLAALSVFTFWLFLNQRLDLSAAALAGVLVLYAIPGRAFLISGLRMLKPLWFFVAIVMVWHIWTDDVAAGLTISLRMLAAVGLANLVTMTTRLDDMVDLVTWAVRPLRRFGLHAAPLGIAIALVIRFTPVLIQKGGLLVESWRSRSPRRPGWQVVVPMTLLAIDDAEHVAEALRARGGLDRQENERT